MKQRYPLEPPTPLAESMVWQLNRDFYTDTGIDAWRNDVVPHNMTSNSIVGKTYASIILGFLKDLAKQGQVSEPVYFLELGAGHGRLAYHILTHLEDLIRFENEPLPPYCYILSDLVEENLRFFENHPQFSDFFELGLLDVCMFDAVESDTINLKFSAIDIEAQQLSQPIVVLANYFFDSIPTDLFFIKDQQINACQIALHTEAHERDDKKHEQIEALRMSVTHQKIQHPVYKEKLYNDILDQYKPTLKETYLLFPIQSMRCLDRIKNLSKGGLMLLSIDKGYADLQDLDHQKVPELIAHGSFSVWVNYHALGSWCNRQKGRSLSPANSSFYLQVACLLSVHGSDGFHQTIASYEENVNRFGPDDFNGVKRMSYHQISRLSIKDLIAMIRLSQYDSTYFKRVLPRIKQISHQVTVQERTRLGEVMNRIWHFYFSIDEDFDMAYELGGLSYDLKFYDKALQYFSYSTEIYGEQADIIYNEALCHYQLREDDLFKAKKKKGSSLFPDFEQFAHLEKLDLNA